ncbi:hypothetical protein F5X97DRAFT_309774, partial [Nemania serpens]
MVATKIFYLARLDRYKTDKPFMHTFDLPPGVGEKTNHEYISQESSVTDVRGQEKEFSLDVHGFQFCNWPTSLSPPDFDDNDSVKNRYYTEIRQHILGTFSNTTEVIVLNHLKRKRDKQFRQIATTEPDYPNPIVFAHADFSPGHAEQIVKRLLETKDREHLRGLSFDFVNVWRVTKEPSRDWPLAVCDYSTISADDVEFTDIIHRDHVGENLRLYSNSHHKWYFLDHQQVSEVLVFRNIHAEGLEVPFAPHVAFEHPDSSPDQYRESVEIRTVRFFKPSCGEILQPASQINKLL